MEATYSMHNSSRTQLSNRRLLALAGCFRFIFVVLQGNLWWYFALGVLHQRVRDADLHVFAHLSRVSPSSHDL